MPTRTAIFYDCFCWTVYICVVARKQNFCYQSNKICRSSWVHGTISSFNIVNNHCFSAIQKQNSIQSFFRKKIYKILNRVHFEEMKQKNLKKLHRIFFKKKQNKTEFKQRILQPCWIGSNFTRTTLILTWKAFILISKVLALHRVNSI